MTTSLALRIVIAVNVLYLPPVKKANIQGKHGNKHETTIPQKPPIYQGFSPVNGKSSYSFFQVSRTEWILAEIHRRCW